MPIGPDPSVLSGMMNASQNNLTAFNAPQLQALNLEKQRLANVEAQQQNQFRPALLQNQVTGGSLGNQAQGITNQFLPGQQAANVGLTQAQGGQTNAAAQQQQLQNVYAKHNLEGQLLSSVTDQESYERALAIAGPSGLPIDNAPAKYDPNFIKQMQQQWLEADQTLKTFGVNAEAAQKGLTSFNPANPTQSVQPSFGDQGRPFQALQPAEQEIVSANAQTIGSAPEFNRNIDNAINLAKSGNIYSGPGSENMAAKDRFLSGTIGQSLGLSGLASTKGAATTQYNNLVGQNLVENLKQQFGARITNTDLEFMHRLQALSDKSPPEQADILQQVKDHFNAKALTMQQEASGIVHGNLANMTATGNIGKTAPGATVINQQGQQTSKNAAPEGTVVKNSQGQSLRKTNGKWVVVNGSQ